MLERQGEVLKRHGEVLERHGEVLERLKNKKKRPEAKGTKNVFSHVQKAPYGRTKKSSIFTCERRVTEKKQKECSGVEYTEHRGQTFAHASAASADSGSHKLQCYLEVGKFTQSRTNPTPIAQQ